MPWNAQDDRRSDVRLASETSVDAVVTDTHGQPRSVLEDPCVLNVSAGGVAIATTSRVDPGERLAMRCPAIPGCAQTDTRFEVEALEAVAWRRDRLKVRCRLTSGHIPAQLMHGW